MKNWDIITDDWKQWMYLNWAYFIHEPIKGNIDKLVKEFIKSDISSLYTMCLILSWKDTTKTLTF